MASSPSRVYLAAIVIGWIVLSTTVILFNRELMVGPTKFSYPITLTTAHLLFQAIATRLLHFFTQLISGPPPQDFDERSLPLTKEKGGESEMELKKEIQGDWKMKSVKLSFSEFKRMIIPPAVLFSASLILSNLAFLYLSVSFIHVLKALSPVAILLAAFAFQTRSFNLYLLSIVGLISLGVGLASLGETKFNLTGFAIQMTAIVIEATRITLVQILLQGEKGMSPLKTLYHFAPICCCINLSLILPLEGWVAIYSLPRIGFFTLLLNCSLTFLLNLSAVYLIAVSSMVLSLSKVVKDVGLVFGSALILGDLITPLQVLGYGIATGGMLWYKVVA